MLSDIEIAKQAKMKKITEIAAGLGQSMFEVISHADEFEPLKRSAAKLLPFAALIQELQRASETMTPSDLYQLLLEKTGYPQYLDRKSVV